MVQTELLAALLKMLFWSFRQQSKQEHTALIISGVISVHYIHFGSFSCCSQSLNLNHSHESYYTDTISNKRAKLIISDGDTSVSLRTQRSINNKTAEVDVKLHEKIKRRG